MNPVRLVAGSAFACLACAAPAGVVAGGFAPVDHLPFAARVESVIDRGEIEGHRVSILRFDSPLPAQAVLQRSRSRWAGGSREPLVEAVAGSWRTLSTHDEGGWRTLQVRPRSDGGSEGMLSVWAASPGAFGTALSDTRGAAAHDPLGVPAGDVAASDAARFLPAGTTVLRRLGAVDAGRHSVSLVALVPGGPRWTADALHASLTAAAFTRDPLVREPARWYRRPGTEIAFTVQPHHGRTALVLHLTRSAR